MVPVDACVFGIDLIFLIGGQKLVRSRRGPILNESRIVYVCVYSDPSVGVIMLFLCTLGQRNPQSGGASKQQRLPMFWRHRPSERWSSRFVVAGGGC
jgi:hypothetical protein